MKLLELQIGQKGYISHVDGDARFVKRLIEMGFIAGEEVAVMSKAPLADPREYMVKGTCVTLRGSEARKIKITTARSSAECSCCCGCSGCTLSHIQPTAPDAATKCKKIRVALVGNPNSGKTTLFNRISGGHEHEANYAGCTVDSHLGTLRWEGAAIELVDLPGTYSLSTFSPEEQYVTDWLRDERPDVILNVMDATNLQRNLYLTTQLYDSGIPIIGALNMYDQLEKASCSLDAEALSQRLGFPCHPVVSRSGRGIHELLDDIVDYRDHQYSYPAFDTAAAADENGRAAMRYGFVNGVLDGIYHPATGKEKWTAAIDRVVTHRLWGFPIFLLVLYAMFQLTFTLGDYPMGWIEDLVGYIGGAISGAMAEGWMRDLLVDGIIGGLGSVIVFLPNILILYFCIAILEDTGYMARAAYIMDRLMRAIGLHGRSFIPMIMGFGCNVPAIMAARSIENHRARLITVLVMPFMSCSARLPVYLLLAGTFFPAYAGLVLTGLYLTGIVAAVVSAKLFDSRLSQRNNTPYIMELPAYRVPFMRSAVRRMWDKGSQYLRKMGSVILVASVAVWTLGYFPQHPELEAAQQQEQSYLGRLGKAVTPVFDPMGANWKMDVGIIAGLGAKEVVVSTLGVLYNANEEDDESTDSLGEILSSQITPAAALAYMLFILLYMPCFATVAAIGREAGHWKWALLAAVYTTAFAWIVAAGAYQLLTW